MELPTSAKLKICPFCEGLAEFGINSCDSWDVRCTKCGARIIQGLPNEFPKGVYIRDDFQKTQVNLANWAYKKLLPKWNKRVNP